MNKTRAAEIWAKLERALVGQLMSGSQLDLKRPYLIRLIGDQLEAENELPSRAVAAKSVSPPLPHDELVRITKSTSDTIIDAHWSRLLDRACAPRMGYDAEDEVTYAPRE